MDTNKNTIPSENDITPKRSCIARYHDDFIAGYLILSPLIAFSEYSAFYAILSYYSMIGDSPMISDSPMIGFFPLLTITMFCLLLFYKDLFDLKPNYPRRNKEFDSLIPVDMEVLKNTFVRWGKSEVERSVPNKVERDALYVKRKRILDFPQFTDKTMCDNCKTDQGTILRQCMHVLCTDCVSVKCDNGVCKGRGKTDISYYINYEKTIIWDLPSPPTWSK